MKVSVQLDFVKLWSYVFFNLKEMEIKIRKGGGIENWLMERQQQVVREGELQGISTEIPRDLVADKI